MRGEEERREGGKGRGGGREEEETRENGTNEHQAKFSSENYATSPLPGYIGFQVLVFFLKYSIINKRH